MEKRGKKRKLKGRRRGHQEKENPDAGKKSCGIEGIDVDEFRQGTGEKLHVGRERIQFWWGGMKRREASLTSSSTRCCEK